MKPDSWPPEDLARLRTWYVDMLMSPAAIAKRLGVKVTRVTRKAYALRLADERALSRADLMRDLSAAGYAGRLRKKVARGEFVWTKEHQAALERMYLDEDLPSAVIAERLGCTPTQVRRRVTWTKLGAKRRAKGIRRQRVRRLKPEAAVTRLRTGHAAGTTRWEDQLHTARAPRPVPLVSDTARGGAR